MRTQWSSISEFPNNLVVTLEPVGLLRNHTTNVQLPYRLLAKALCAYVRTPPTDGKRHYFGARPVKPKHWGHFT